MFWRDCDCPVSCKVVVEGLAVGILVWAFSSDGRAPASHAGGRGIDTSNVHVFDFEVLVVDGSSGLRVFGFPCLCVLYNVAVWLCPYQVFVGL